MRSVPFSFFQDTVQYLKRKPLLSYGVKVGLVFVVYYLTAKGGLQLDAVSGFATLVWPPTGIALASLFIFGYRLWPGIFLAAFFVNYFNGASFLIALFIGIGNTLEGLIGVMLLKKNGSKNILGHVRGALLFILFAAVISTLISATIGTGSLLLSGNITVQTFYSTWLAWWIGDMLGALIVGSLLINFRYGIVEEKSVPRLIEGMVFGSLLLLFALFLFLGFSSNLFMFEAYTPFLYLIYPFLIWAAVRFGPIGASASIFLVSLISVWGTVLGKGPFSAEELSLGLLLLQIFIGSTAATNMVLAAAVAEHIQSKKMLERMALQDALTGLPNRKALKEQLEQALIHAEIHQCKVALLFLDLDKFKYINDTFGHHIGDIVLQEVANRLRQFGKGENMVARHGGDEFIILLPDVSSESEVTSVAEKILHTLEEPLDIDDQPISISGSLGIALSPNDGMTTLSLLRNADSAVYRAKKGSRGRYQLYNQSMSIENSRQFSLGISLRQAIVRGELEIYYQPIIDTRSNQIYAAEALVRWNHPIFGLLSPDEFIPVAEEWGLIFELGNWVLHEAVFQAKRWHTSGLGPFHIAVNLTALQFSEANLIPTLTQLLEEAGFSSKWLQLEITETTAMENVDLTRLRLKKLKEMGIDVTIDDFGTGYSSLSYLRRFTLAGLKIDRSFIDQGLFDSQESNITRTIIAMAQNMNLTVCAEGVSTKEQMEYLRNLRCYLIQGYYYSEPLSADKFSTWCRSYAHGKNNMK